MLICCIEYVCETGVIIIRRAADPATCTHTLGSTVVIYTVYRLPMERVD